MLPIPYSLLPVAYFFMEPTKWAPARARGGRGTRGVRYMHLWGLAGLCGGVQGEGTRVQPIAFMAAVGTGPGP